MTYGFGRLSYEGLSKLSSYASSFESAANDFKKANNITEGSTEATTLEKMERDLKAIAGEAVASEAAAIEVFLTKYSLKGTAIESLLKNAGGSAGAMLTEFYTWSPDIFPTLNAALGKYSGLAAELTQNTNLLAHFYGMNTSYYYRLGLARAYKVTGDGAISLPDNFGEALKDLEIKPGVTLRSIFSKEANQVSSILGKELEVRVGAELENGFAGGAAGIQNANIPDDLKKIYLQMYDDGYRKVIQQVSITTSAGKSPVPDLFFFKLNGDGKLSMKDVIYHDVKLYVSTNYSKAQQTVESTMEAAKASKIPAQFVLTDELVFEGETYPAGTSLTLKEMGKVSTVVTVPGNSINLIYTPTIALP